MGQAGRPRWRAADLRHLGGLRDGRDAGATYSTTSSPAPGLPGRQGRSLRLLRRDAAARASVSGISKRWWDADWMLARGGKHRSPRRCRPTRSTSAPGGGYWRKGTASHPTRDGVRPSPSTKKTGFTHVEMLPVMEAPVLRLLGLPVARLLRADQPLRHAAGLMLPDDTCTSRGSASSRLGGPPISRATRHGLIFFDGTHLYEHADRARVPPRWSSYIFTYGRNEVRAF